MARKNVILRLRKHLTARREALRKALKLEIADLRNLPGLASGDSADAASDAAHHELSSQLAELESRELVKIERALQRIRAGTYGSCESCAKKIPLARLNALPYTTLCVACQRDEESGLGGPDIDERGWDKVYDNERSLRDDNIRLSDIELDLSGSGR
jgi:DnaK suppressor protein